MTTMAAVSAATQVHICPGWREVSSSTVASAEGPASKGTASGKTIGSLPSVPPKISDVLEKIILMATSSRMTPPATSSAGWLRPMMRKNPCPPHMKASNTT